MKNKTRHAPETVKATISQEREMAGGIVEHEAVNLAPQAVVIDVVEPLAAASPGNLTATQTGSFGQAAETGMQMLERATDLPFAQFVTNIITGVFEALMAANIRQIEAYTQLVADLGKTIKDFEIANVNDAEVTRFLAEHYPDGNGGTTVRADYKYADTPASDNSAKFFGSQKLATVYNDLVNVRLKDVWGTSVVRPVDPPNFNKDTLTCGVAQWKCNVSDGTTTKEWNPIPQIRSGVRRFLATGMLDQLRKMAKDGMIRLTVPSGKIEARVTYRISTTDEHIASSNQYHQDQFGAYVQGHAQGGFWGVRAGAEYAALNVQTANQYDFNSITTSGELIGSVSMNFMTETFPSIP